VNVDPDDPAAIYATDAEFRTIALEALEVAYAVLQRPQFVVAGTDEAARLVATARTLRDAIARLAPPAPAVLPISS